MVERKLFRGSTSAGYIFPVEDCGFYSINRKYYPSYPGHTGTDINIGVYGKGYLLLKQEQLLLQQH